MRIILCTYLKTKISTMKRCVAALFVLFFSVMLKGQAPFPDKEEIRQFTVSTTCVVLEDDQLSTYNSVIKDAVKEFWTITPYEIITVSEFNVRRLKPEYSFIVLTQTNYEKDKSNSFFNFLNLLQGKNTNNLGLMPEICAVPLSFAGEDDLDYSYKLGAILSFIQEHARMISEDPSLTGRKYLKYYNKNIPKVSDKTILVKEEDLSPSLASIDKIEAIFPHKIEIVSEDDIIKAIENKSENTLVLHMVGPAGEQNAGFCFKMLIGTDDADMYYYHQHKIDKNNPNGLLPADLKRLAK